MRELKSFLSSIYFLFSHFSILPTKRNLRVSSKIVFHIAWLTADSSPYLMARVAQQNRRGVKRQSLVIHDQPKKKKNLIVTYWIFIVLNVEPKTGITAVLFVWALPSPNSLTIIDESSAKHWVSKSNNTYGTKWYTFG